VSRTAVALTAVGDLLLDVVVTPRRPIARGSDVPGSVTFRRGGSAANTAAAFARLGGRASLITSLGTDAWAGYLVRSLRAEGVRVRAVHHDGASGRLAAIVDERGERSFVTERAAADLLAPDDLEPAWLDGTTVLHVPGYSLYGEPIGTAALQAAALARAAGALVSCDLSSAVPLLGYGPRRARARLGNLGPDVLFATRDEAAALLGRTGRRSWPGLLAWAGLAVVKDGGWGCRLLWAADGLERQDDVAAMVARPAADSTGAGDAFAAGFLATLVRAGAPVTRWPVRTLRRAAMAGHRAAAEALRRGRPALEPGQPIRSRRPG
jgi:sugar/nucleoside kinase (ribokinase family)